MSFIFFCLFAFALAQSPPRHFTIFENEVFRFGGDGDFLDSEDWSDEFPKLLPNPLETGARIDSPRALYGLLKDKDDIDVVHLNVTADLINTFPPTFIVAVPFVAACTRFKHTYLRLQLTNPDGVLLFDISDEPDEGDRGLFTNIENPQGTVVFAPKGTNFTCIFCDSFQTCEPDAKVIFLPLQSTIPGIGHLIVPGTWVLKISQAETGWQGHLVNYNVAVGINGDATSIHDDVLRENNRRIQQDNKLWRAFNCVSFEEADLSCP